MSDVNSDGLRLLLLDDDDLSRELSGKIFSYEQAHVIHAATVSEAERELRASPGVHLVSVDISLGGEGRDKQGAELARRIRASQPDLPIIGYSSYFSEDELSEDERAAFTGYFARGGSTSDVQSWVERCLDEAVRYRESRRGALYQQLVDAANRSAVSGAGQDFAARSEPAPLGADLDRLLDATSSPEAAEYLATAGTRLEQSAAAGLEVFAEAVQPLASEEPKPHTRLPNLQNLAVGLVYLEFRLDELGRKLDEANAPSGLRRHLDDTTKVVAVLAGVVAAVVGIVRLLGG